MLETLSVESRWLTRPAYDMLVTKVIHRAQEILASQGIQHSAASLRRNRVQLVGRMTEMELCNDAEALAQKLAQRVVGLIPSGWLTTASNLGDFFRVAQVEGCVNARKMHSFLLAICRIRNTARGLPDPMETDATLWDALTRIHDAEREHGRDFAMQCFFAGKPIMFRELSAIMARHGLSLFESSN